MIVKIYNLRKKIEKKKLIKTSSKFENKKYYKKKCKKK